MEFNPIERFAATVPLSVFFESSYAGVHVTGVSMTDGPVAVKGLDGGDLPVVQVNEQPDDKIWPDGMEDLGLVSANQSRTCPDISEMVYHTVHEEPLILYIPNFVFPDETLHLLNITKDSFSPAWVYQGGASKNDDSFRKSENAWPSQDDEVVQCLEQRAVRFQKWQSNLLLEQISLQRYHENGFFSYHHDQFPSPRNRLNRYSTFNVFLQGDCTGGGTHFPRIPRPADSAWCKYIDCESSEPGVIFKPIAGSAVFWVNTRDDGSGYEETLHAGMPVKSGTKVGMNIWSWKDTREDKSGPSLAVQ